MPTLPTNVTPPTTLPSAFFTFQLNGQTVAKGTSVDWGMQYQGDWVQAVGEDRPTRNPNMKWGRGTLARANVFGNALGDILVASQMATANQLSTTGVDMRFIPLTATCQYNDGQRKIIKTLQEVYITEETFRAEGNRIQMVNVPFEYAIELTQ